MDEKFSAYKIHPGNLSIEDTIKVVDGVRDLVGDNMSLMLDRNHGYSLAEALRVLKSNIMRMMIPSVNAIVLTPF